jgi:hypothetical protein
MEGGVLGTSSTGHILMLVRKVAVEFNHELQLIAMESHKLLQSVKNDDPNRMAIVTINKAASRAITLIRQLLGFDDL